jgi:Transglycosylase SLT domain
MVALFRKYGQRYSVDWLLMAAQGYQESQLDQERHSQVGAIGVMQLMPATGREMNVGDVTQLEFNIHAGVKYMRLLVDTYFNDQKIDPLNKLLFAFAAYNAGPGRMRSLRDEARSRNLDPNIWFNNVERVAAERIGRETVQYVANIYKYYVAYTLVQEEVERDLRKANRPTMRPSVDHQPERRIMSNRAAPPARAGLPDCVWYPTRYQCSAIGPRCSTRVLPAWRVAPDNVPVVRRGAWNLPVPSASTLHALVQMLFITR